MLASLGAAPATAQVGASLTLQSDDRFRGRSLSDGRPVIVGGLSYDDGSGAYVGGSATAILTGEDRAGLMGARAYGGYAVRMGSGVSLDLGVVGYRYTHRYSGGREVGYVEAYGGVSRGGLSAGVRYSPDYFERGVGTVYLEGAATREIARGWSVTGGVGLLTQLSGPPRLGGRTSRYDARLGVSRDAGLVQLSADLTVGGPDGAYYDGPFSGRSALVLSATRAF